MAKNLVCTEQTYADNRNGLLTPYKPQPVQPPIGTVPGYTAGNWGTTTANMQTLFPENIYTNFANNPNLNAQMGAMQLPMLAQLSTELWRLDTTGAYLPGIMKYAALKLSAANLVTLRGAFGTFIDTYVADYSPAAVKTAYQATKPINPIFLSHYFYQVQGLAATPLTSQMAYYDVFLDQYTAANETPTVAVHKATTYIQTRLPSVKGLEEIGIGVGAAALIFAIVNFFDPNAWQDMVNVYNGAFGKPPPDTTPYPGLQDPPGTVPLMPPWDPGSPPDPSDPVIPPYDYPGDGGYDICGDLGLGYC